MEVPDVRSGNPKRLAEMLSCEAEPQGLWDSTDLAAILRHQLSVSCAVDLDAADPSASGSRPETGAGLQLGSFAELFQAPDPPLELLKRIKEFAKASLFDAEFPLPRDIATVLYFASIAVAFVRCDQRITGLTDAALRNGFAWVAEQSWVPESLRAVCRDALNRID